MKDQSSSNTILNTPPLDEKSKVLRRLVIEALEGGGRGHLGSSLSLIEIIRTLYDDILKHRPHEPKWEDRDRFLLSKGHGCLALYAVLADHGYFPRGELKKFCRDGTYLGGHPEAGKIPGVEASTGALGHGLSIGVGMALAARIKKKDNKVFVVMGDGEINEGSVWEAAMSAGKHKLNNLVAVVDYNKIQSYGFVSEVQPLEPLIPKWEAFGFRAVEVDGHDCEALIKALSTGSCVAGKPTMVICHTVKGKGIAFAENEPSWHHKSNIPNEQIAAIYEALGVN